MEEDYVTNYGVIRMAPNKQFVIYCCYCNEKLCKMKEFEQHIYDAHIINKQVSFQQKHDITTKPQIYVIPKIENNSVELNNYKEDDNIKPKLKYLEITTLSPINKTDLMSSTESLSDNLNLKCQDETFDLENYENLELNQKKFDILLYIPVEQKSTSLPNKTVEIGEKPPAQNDNNCLPNKKKELDQKLIKILENELKSKQKNSNSTKSDNNVYLVANDDGLENIRNDKIIETDHDYTILSDSDDDNDDLHMKNENFDEKIMKNFPDNEINHSKNNIKKNDERFSNNSNKNINDKFKSDTDSDLDDENLKSFLDSLCSDSEEEIFNKIVDDYYCLKCNRKFKKLYNFEKHKHLHDVEFQCKECGLKCSTKKQLTLHQRIHSNMGPLVCNICSKEFRTKITFKNHHKIHFGDRKFSCDWCGDKRRFFYMREKLIHERTMHTKDYQFQCELCGRGFATQSFLKRHKRYHHTTDRNFICKICNKAFTTREGVYRHEKIHSSDRPYKCDECPSQFVCSSHLKRHKQTHTGIKPFQCEICKKYFTRKVNLNDHLKTIHDKKFNNEPNILVV